VTSGEIRSQRIDYVPTIQPVLRGPGQMSSCWPGLRFPATTRPRSTKQIRGRSSRESSGTSSAASLITWSTTATRRPRSCRKCCRRN